MKTASAISVCRSSADLQAAVDLSSSMLQSAFHIMTILPPPLTSRKASSFHFQVRCPCVRIKCIQDVAFVHLHEPCVPSQRLRSVDTNRTARFRFLWVRSIRAWTFYHLPCVTGLSEKNRPYIRQETSLWTNPNYTRCIGHRNITF